MGVRSTFISNQALVFLRGRPLELHVRDRRAHCHRQEASSLLCKKVSLVRHVDYTPGYLRGSQVNPVTHNFCQGIPPIPQTCAGMFHQQIDVSHNTGVMHVLWDFFLRTYVVECVTVSRDHGTGDLATNAKYFTATIHCGGRAVATHISGRVDGTFHGRCGTSVGGGGDTFHGRVAHQ